MLSRLRSRPHIDVCVLNVALAAVGHGVPRVEAACLFAGGREPDGAGAGAELAAEPRGGRRWHRDDIPRARPADPARPARHITKIDQRGRSMQAAYVL